MSTPLEDFLKMSAQEREGVESVQRPMMNNYQKLQLPQFTQDVREALPAGMNFSPDQVQAAMDKASPSYAALSTDPERQRADDQIRAAQIAAMRDPSYAGSPEARRAGLGLATSISNAPDGLPFLPDAATLADLDQKFTPVDDGPRGPAGPRGPSIYDLQKGGLDRLLASQKEGFGQQRDLVEQLADLR